MKITGLLMAKEEIRFKYRTVNRVLWQCFMGFGDGSPIINVDPDVGRI